MRHEGLQLVEQTAFSPGEGWNVRETLSRPKSRYPSRRGHGMAVIIKVAPIVVLAALAGCATTGGDIGGLFPAPKFLKGTIRNNIYTTSDGSLSVAIPHKEGSYEYQYMQVKEQYSPQGDYISFGPAALDKSIYRVETSKRVTTESATTDRKSVV